MPFLIPLGSNSKIKFSIHKTLELGKGRVYWTKSSFTQIMTAGKACSRTITAILANIITKAANVVTKMTGTGAHITWKLLFRVSTPYGYLETRKKKKCY